MSNHSREWLRLELNSTLKFHKAARHQLAVITAVDPFCGPAVRGYACLERGAVPLSTKGGDPKCQEELAQRFPSLDTARKIIRQLARSSRRQRGIPRTRDS